MNTAAGKMLGIYIGLQFVMTATILSGCVKQESAPPVITLDTQIYTAAVGESVTVAPKYENCGNATYEWTLDGRCISEEPVLTFSSNTAGRFYILLTVTNGASSDKAEIRIDIYDNSAPAISLPGASLGFTVLQDSLLVLTPTVISPSNTTYSWSVNGEELSKELSFTVPTSASGVLHVGFSAENAYGKSEVLFDVAVLAAEDAPFSWTFETLNYSLSSGRNILLAPADITYAFDAIYIWCINGEERQSDKNPEYLFTDTAEGIYNVEVTMRNAYREVSQHLSVQVSPPEGTYRRKAGPDSSPFANKIYEFTAAPGQFINDGYTAKTMEEACRYAEERLASNLFVSLGAFGGYLVAGFDHSIDNSGGYDLQITGNAHESSSEPGIIWVMQDENGDGLPNDTWYELRGSEYGKPETVRDYAVTYYRPSGPKMSVEWSDNLGNYGTIDYLGAYHRQDSYFPEWITAGSYTLRGTRLKDRMDDVNGNGSLWISRPYDWGYADNFGGEDIDKFRISDAVRHDGTPANLAYIDFVKIQCGVQAKGGLTGEMSTDITLIKALNE